MSIDPVGFLDTGEPSYFNRYRYCANDPINCTDPTGKSDAFGTTDDILIPVVKEAFRPVVEFFTEDAIEAGNAIKNGDIKAAALPVAKAVVKPLKAATKLKSLASKTKVGDKVKTPDNAKGDFTKLKGGQGFKDTKTGTIMQKSKTNHSKSPGGEFKAGVKPGKPPTKSQKVTISGGKQGGCVIKKDGC